jgi:hypothetical protein
VLLFSVEYRWCLVDHPLHFTFSYSQVLLQPMLVDNLVASTIKYSLVDYLRVLLFLVPIL